MRGWWLLILCAAVVLDAQEPRPRARDIGLAPAAQAVFRPRRTRSAKPKRPLRPAKTRSTPRTTERTATSKNKIHRINMLSPWKVTSR